MLAGSRSTCNHLIQIVQEFITCCYDFVECSERIQPVIRICGPDVGIQCNDCEDDNRGDAVNIRCYTLVPLNNYS